MRVPFDEMQNVFRRILLPLGFIPERASLCARLFAEASLDGIHSHGLNRFPGFVDFIREGIVVPDAEPMLTDRFGVIERWDGQSGPGNLNAWFSMNRAVELAGQYGIGCVALRNTNHWMRGGSYGWQAAHAGCVGICWTNTMPNLPPWGAANNKLGNNPLVLAVPRKEGHLVLDMAMSQFSYGQLNNYAMSNRLLPVDGGYDSTGNLTRDPAQILKSGRLLPIGYWKGSGLSLMLDMIGVILSGGRSTMEIGTAGPEQGVTQVFLAIDTTQFPDITELQDHIRAVVQDLHSAEPPDDAAPNVRYPGEDTVRRRAEYEREGIPVDPAIWNRVLRIEAEANKGI